MSIQFKGYLKDTEQLKKSKVDGLNQLEVKWIDYFLAFIIIIYPLLRSIKLLVSKYNGQLSDVILADIAGFIIIIILMVIHEYLHAMTFSKNEEINIWIHGFGMITHCTQRKNIKSYIFTFLFPNLVIALPLSIFVSINFILEPLILKTIGLISSIILLGTISDISYIICIVRNGKNISYLQFSGENLYFRKK